jgi:nucleoside-diphosphate-sugar epimerase
MDANLIIVTGASGFLGRYAVAQLVDAGFAVVAVSRSPLPIEIPACKPMPLDLEDPASIETLSGAFGGRARALVHFAAAIPRSFVGDEAEECGRRNLRMDGNILRFCEDTECALVYGSSSSVYPAESQAIKTEDAEINPAEPYAREKLASERAFLLHLPSHSIALRITAPYGPGQTANTVVKIFLERALRDEPVMYHGSGAREQDFIHASDVARAVVCSVRQSSGGVFNIAAGAPVTMKQLADTVVGAVSGSKSVVQPSGKPDPQEQRYASFSIEKARTLLGWAPATSFEDGIREWAELIRSEGRYANRAPF